MRQNSTFVGQFADGVTASIIAAKGNRIMGYDAYDVLGSIIFVHPRYLNLETVERNFRPLIVDIYTSFQQWFDDDSNF